MSAPGAFARAAAQVGPLDGAAVAAARARHALLAKPLGSLGRLEDLGAQLAGIAGACPPPVPEPAAVAVFAADHGVACSGVTPWPQDVTGRMVAACCAGGAAISVLARQVGARLVVVDVGVAGDLPPHPLLVDRKVARGSADLCVGPALDVDQTVLALDAGAETAARLVADGARLLVTGEMGIGNTTPAAAVVASLTGADASRCTGRGTGIDDATLARKTDVVVSAVARLPEGAGPLEVVRRVGGLDIAALAGFVVGGAALGVPVVVDGVIALAALLVADAHVPGVRHRVVAGHRSTEPGATVALEHLGLVPVLDLGMRLGEGTGACLAVPVVQAAARVVGQMATLGDAGVVPPG
ncbi:MAG: nicotinate-nucleotide--dimethylbenzimidazole phosphoribosyltransferase [Acidimicrobiales bacterium]|nr:nicotinate-nucleotide--dimethylbenzimidazole phosphoribosyltransferase [Acidimicrobiales bacterium]